MTNETYEERMARLREATRDVAPAPELVAKLVEDAERMALESSIWDTIGMIGRWFLLPAVAVPLALCLVLNTSSDATGELVYLASALGWAP